MHDHAGFFVDDRQVFVFENNVEGDVLGGKFPDRDLSQLDIDLVALAQFVRRFRGLFIDQYIALFDKTLQARSRPRSDLAGEKCVQTASRIGTGSREGHRRRFRSVIGRRVDGRVIVIVLGRTGQDPLPAVSTAGKRALRKRRIKNTVEAAATIGAAQIQNRGTLGGNIANASPAGDTLPVLLAADATVVVGSDRGEREVRAVDVWTGYRTTALDRDELILRIRIPLAADREMRFRKVGTRRAQSISKVVLAVAWRTPVIPALPADGAMDRSTNGGTDRAWHDVRIALGSVAATPVRAGATEAALEGRSPTPETADLAAETLAGELAPIDDVRSTAEYRRLVAARVLHRIVREAGGW